MKKIILLSALLVTLALPAQATHPGKHILITINGLVCDFCAQSMKKVFGKKTEVLEVDVNLTTKLVRLDMKEGMDLKDEDIRQGIADAGYDVVSIKRD
jgi:copper chaperone CopZ